MTGTSTRTARSRGDLAALAVVAVLLAAALPAGAASLYRELYSPAAFVGRYLSLLSAGRAADALAMPGAELTESQRADAGIPADASDALLRSAALNTLDQMRVLSEETRDNVTTVTVSYRAGGVPGTTTFAVVPDGWVGVVPGWRFERSPLAVMDVAVAGSTRFAVNGFAMDARQIAADAPPGEALPMLVLSPGLYAVGVDTPLAVADPVRVLSDAPQIRIPVVVTARPTAEFTGVVQQRVEDFLTACAAQRVLQPTGCPFGGVIDDRVDSEPVWSIVQQPEVALTPDGAGWRIPDAAAVAHLDVRVRSLFDGRVSEVSEDVPFLVSGTIEVDAAGSASILIGGGRDS